MLWNTLLKIYGSNGFADELKNTFNIQKILKPNKQCSVLKFLNK